MANLKPPQLTFNFRPKWIKQYVKIILATFRSRSPYMVFYLHTYYFNQARLWLHRFLIGFVETVLVFPSKFITAYRHLPPTSANCQGKVSPSLREQWSWQFGQQCSWSSPGNVGCHFSQVSKCFSTTLGLTSRFDVSMCFCLWSSYHRWSCKRLAWQRVLVDIFNGLYHGNPWDSSPLAVFHQHFGRRFFSFFPGILSKCKAANPRCTWNLSLI